MASYIVLKSGAKNIAGQRFGRLIALGPVSRGEHGIVWRCTCDCGESTDVSGHSLRSGNTRSCGCLRRDCSITHGMYGDSVYESWRNMVQRCTNTSNKSYARYGGRGIAVCPEWKHDFQAFYDHVKGLANYGDEGYSIDRIDNDGDYRPGNVRWATGSEQQRNTRNNVILTHGGKTQCVADWSREIGIPVATLSYRLRAGWTAERALTQDVRARGGMA